MVVVSTAMSTVRYSKFKTCLWMSFPYKLFVYTVVNGTIPGGGGGTRCVRQYGGVPL